MVFVTSGSRLWLMFSPMARMTSRPVTRSLANPWTLPRYRKGPAGQTCPGTEADPTEYIRTESEVGELQGEREAGNTLTGGRALCIHRLSIRGGGHDGLEGSEVG